MGLVSVLLFDSPPAWNKRRLFYVNFPLYYLSSDRLRELRKKKANFKFLTLKVVMVASERCQSGSYPNIVM